MDVLIMKSFTKKGIQYELDRKQKTCTCEAHKKDGYCKHLDAVGVYKQKNWRASTHPSFSQALSGLVKSIRARRVEDAIYWLVYLNTMTGDGGRFRVARRLLIGSAEDGHSIAVMEKVVSNFSLLCSMDTHLIQLAAEVVRICKVPNWWDVESNGHDYIYSGMIGNRRKWLYNEGVDSLNTQLKKLEQAIDDSDKQQAMLWLEGLLSSTDISRTKVATYLKTLATSRGCLAAERLTSIHLSAKSALSGDANFLGQAVWNLAGGSSPLENTIYDVYSMEVKDLLAKARDRWANPKLIPGWCCDGVHCGGTDRRYCGMWPDMYALCNVFSHYGNVSPDNEWLPEFFNLDGLDYATS